MTELLPRKYRVKHVVFGAQLPASGDRETVFAHPVDQRLVQVGIHLDQHGFNAGEESLATFNDLAFQAVYVDLDVIGTRKAEVISELIKGHGNAALLEERREGFASVVDVRPKGMQGAAGPQVAESECVESALCSEGNRIGQSVKCVERDVAIQDGEITGFRFEGEHSKPTTGCVYRVDADIRADIPENTPRGHRANPLDRIRLLGEQSLGSHQGQPGVGAEAQPVNLNNGVVHVVSDSYRPFRGTVQTQNSGNDARPEVRNSTESHRENRSTQRPLDWMAEDAERYVEQLEQARVTKLKAELEGDAE